MILEKYKLVYGELTHDFPIVKDMATFFIIEPEGDQSKITIEVHPQNISFLSKIALVFFKGVLSKNIKNTIKQLKSAAEKEQLIAQ